MAGSQRLLLGVCVANRFAPRSTACSCRSTLLREKLTTHAPSIIFAATLYDNDKSNAQVRAGIVKNSVELLGRYVSDLFVRDRSASHVSAVVLPMPTRAKGSRSHLATLEDDESDFPKLPRILFDA